MSCRLTLLLLAYLLTFEVLAEISGSPNPAAVGSPVTLFSSDSTAALKWIVYKGDSTPLELTGNPVTFTPLKPGGYFVSASMDKIILSAFSISATDATADSDSDGVPNELEIALGTDPKDIRSKPIDTPSTLVLLQGDNLKIILDKSKSSNDSVALNLTFIDHGPIPPALEGGRVAFQIGAFVRVY
jgi:hypothetical protein